MTKISKYIKLNIKSCTDYWYVENIIILIIASITIGLTWLRLFYGTEITDEAYYIANARLVANGVIPFVNVVLFSGNTLLYFWLVPLYEIITGSTEGLFLYMRWAYFIYKLLTLFAIFFLLRKYIRPQTLVLFLLTMVPFAQFNILMFSYNTLSAMLLLLSSALIIRAFYEDAGKNAILCGVAAGFTMTLCCLAYPTQIVNAVLLSIILFTVAWKKKKEKPNRCYIPLAYVVTGLMSATVILVILIIAGGGLKNVYNDICIQLTAPYYSYLSSKSASSYIKMFLIESRYLIWSVAIFILLYLIQTIWRHYHKSWAPLSLKYSIALACGIGLIICKKYVLLMYIPLFYAWLAPKEKKPMINLLLCFLWLPFLIYYAVVSYSTISTFYAIRDHAYFCGMISVLFFSWAIADSTIIQNTAVKSAQYDHCKRNINMTILVAVIFITVSIINVYSVIYRDEPYSRLNHKIQYGVYKGIYTTKHRQQGLIEIEKIIGSITNRQDQVLFMDVVPFAYLMSDASFCTPSSWDIMQYTYGFNDDKLMHAYFRAVNKMPNKIIYIHTGRDKVVSIDKEDYLFSQFVRKNYVLTYENKLAAYPVKMYELK